MGNAEALFLAESGGCAIHERRHPTACEKPTRQDSKQSGDALPTGFAILGENLMRKLLASFIFMALAGTLVPAAPQRDRDDRHDNGKRKGRDKHDDDRGDHDNGKHKGWDKHDRDDYRGWKYDEARVRPGRAYPHGHYEHVREVFVARRMDYRTRHVFLYDNSDWVVASYDVDRCPDWECEGDHVYVYDDDHHPGWYLLFNARLGRYVHVEYFGVH